MDSSLPCKVVINGVEVDLESHRLRRLDGRTALLRPQSFATLRYLVANANRLVSKAELHEAVWFGAAVTDDSLVQCIHAIRQALGDEDRSLLQTVSRRGYRLNLPEDRAAAPGGSPIAVLPFAPADRGGGLLQAVAGRGYRLSRPEDRATARGGSSIAVLPFATGDEVESYF